MHSAQHNTHQARCYTVDSDLMFCIGGSSPKSEPSNCTLGSCNGIMIGNARVSNCKSTKTLEQNMSVSKYAWLKFGMGKRISSILT